jgi:hypothetical protein
MMTKAKIHELRTRMFNHKMVDGMAVVEITARELQELLEVVDRKLCLYCIGYGYHDKGFQKDKCVQCKGSGMKPIPWWRKMFGGLS